MTGVANPGPIISSLWADDDAESTLVLDGVVTVVDTVNIIGYLDNPGEHFLTLILSNACNMDLKKKQATMYECRLHTQIVFFSISPTWLLNPRYVS